MESSRNRLPVTICHLWYTSLMTSNKSETAGVQAHKFLSGTEFLAILYFACLVFLLSAVKRYQRVWKNTGVPIFTRIKAPLCARYWFLQIKSNSGRAFREGLKYRTQRHQIKRKTRRSRTSYFWPEAMHHKSNERFLATNLSLQTAFGKLFSNLNC